MHRFLLLAAAAAFVTGAPAQSKGMKWMDATGVGLPAGGQIAVVKGDPSKAAPFTVRIKMPAGYTVPPHKHPGDEVVRVVSAGTLSYGMGDKLDKANVGSLTKGYHVTMMAGMNHYVFTTDPIEVQVDGMGPFAITYADPKDDPRTK
jgi:quercetin dioxygenase-like cupin family protein